MKALALLLLAAPTAAPKVELLDFTATYCPACRTMDPIVDRMKQAGYPVRRIDISAHPDLTQRFRVDLLPTFIVLRDGREVGRIVGPTPEANLRQLVRSAVPRKKSVPKTAGAPERKSTPETRLASTESLAPKRRPEDEIRLNSERPERKRPAIRGQAPSKAKPSPMSASVRVKLSNSVRTNSGSGTIIDNHPDGWALILTCAHVVNGLDTAEALVEVDLFQDGEHVTYQGRVLEHNIDADVGLITIRTEEPLPFAKIANAFAKPREGDDVFSIGCGLGEAPTMRHMNVVEVDRYDGPANIECSTVPEQGRSGGALFNKQGEIIGVCSAADEKRDEGLYAGPQAIFDILTQVGVHHLFEAESSATPERPPVLEVAGDLPDDQVLSEIRDSDALSLRDALSESGLSEVTCIIRPLDGAGKSRVVIIHQVSEEFLALLEGGSTGAEGGPTPTMLSSRTRQGETAANVRRPQLHRPLITKVRDHRTNRIPVPLLHAGK